MIFVWFVYVVWGLVVTYLTVAGARVKRNTQPHVGQSVGLTAALVVAFVLPHVPGLGFVNYAPVGTGLSLAGLVVFVIGIALFVIARRELGANWSQTVSAKQEPELVTSGLYRYVRHPMYAAGLLASIGSAVVVGGPFVFLVLFLTPIFLWRVGAEDRLMTEQFPRAYPAYKERTKGLIPYVW